MPQAERKARARGVRAKNTPRKGSSDRRRQKKAVFAMCEKVIAGDRVVADELERLATGNRRVAWLVKHWRKINKKRFFSRSPTTQSWRVGGELYERLQRRGFADGAAVPGSAIRKVTR